MQTFRFPALAVLIFALVAACSDAVDPPTAADLSTVRQDPKRGGDEGVVVCHEPEHGGRLLEVSTSALKGHLGHGDYLARYEVDPLGEEATTLGRYLRIWQALDAVRAGRVERGELTSAACRITIDVASGEYVGGFDANAPAALERFPILIDVPDITLHGALMMKLDADGRATGEGWRGGESVLSPVQPLPFKNGLSIPIIIANAHPGGSAGDGLVVKGFVFRSGHDPLVDAGGQGILSLRVTRLVILGNRFEGGFTESVDLRASSGHVALNHLSGTAGTCDLCLAGPGTFTATGNRLLSGGIPGIAVSPTVLLPVPDGVEQYELPASADTRVALWNNEIQAHQRVPVGVGIRLDAIGVGAPDVQGAIHAVVHHNSLLNNRFGMIVHAAFPVAGTRLRGDVDLALGQNEFKGSCQTDLFVAFSRHQTGLGIDAKPRPFLLNSTFRLSLHENLRWAEAWYSHPDGYGNTLVVDGATVAPGQVAAYDPAKPCP